jgi:hypothetical protein
MWYDLALNPKAVTAIYGGEEPSLRNAHITSLNLNWSGPSAIISIQLSNFPTKPPAKYFDNEWNTAIATLQLINVETLHINGWGTQNLVDIDIRRVDTNHIVLSAKGEQCDIEVIFGFLEVGISGFHQSK